MGTLKLEYSVLGGFPRNRRVRHLVRDHENGLIDDLTYHRVLREETMAVLSAQEALGYKVLVDGMLDWHDIFRPFVNSWRGVYPSGLLRYFDNNFFYRIPVFHEAPEPMNYVWSNRIVWLDERFPGKTIKIVVPGPVTFTALSHNRTGKPDKWLLEKISYALNKELKQLNKGEILVQVDEPALIDIDFYSAFKGLIGEAYDVLFEGVSARKSVAIYFGCPVEEAYRELVDYGELDFIVLDMVNCSKDRLFHLVSEQGVTSSTIGLGVIESRDLFTDSYESIRDTVWKLAEATNIDAFHLTTSTWLDLIPYEYALLKTRLLSDYVTRLEREVVTS